MRIIVVHTLKHPATIAALERYGRQVEYVDVTGDPLGYYAALARVWCDGVDFANVEQDMLPTPATFYHFERCPRWLCSASEAFGALRCRAELMARAPDLFDRIPAGERSWRRLCWGFFSTLYAAMPELGGQPCNHPYPARQARVPGAAVGWPHRFAALSADEQARVMAEAVAPPPPPPEPPQPPPDWRVGIDFRSLGPARPDLRDRVERRRQAWMRYYGRSAPSLDELHAEACRRGVAVP